MLADLFGFKPRSLVVLFRQHNRRAGGTGRKVEGRFLFFANVIALAIGGRTRTQQGNSAFFGAFAPRRQQAFGAFDVAFGESPFLALSIPQQKKACSGVLIITACFLPAAGKNRRLFYRPLNQ